MKHSPRFLLDERWERRYSSVMTKRMSMLMILLLTVSLLYAGGAFNVDAGYTYSKGWMTGEENSSSGLLFELGGKGYMSPSFALGGGIFVHIPVSGSLESVRFAPNMTLSYVISLSKALYFEPAAGISFLFSPYRTEETSRLHSEIDLLLEAAFSLRLQENAAFRIGLKGYMPLIASDYVKNITEGTYTQSDLGIKFFHITPFLGVSIVL